MLKNYLKLAARNIARKKLYTIINLSGLGVASAFCILIYWYVQHENSFDKFHKNTSQLYRVEIIDPANEAQTTPPKKNGLFSFLGSDGESPNMIVTPPVLAIELQKNFPEIEYAVRLGHIYEKKVRINNQSFVEKGNVAYVDKDFFTTFNYPLLRGNPSTVLDGHNNIVISEKIAGKYFGNIDAIGKTIMFPNDDSSSFIVSGIVKDFPVNSSFQYDMLIPRTSAPYYDEDIKNGTNTSKDWLFVQLRKDVSLQTLQAKLDRFSKQFFGPAPNQSANGEAADFSHIYLRPFVQAHNVQSSGWGHFTNSKNIYQLISITIVLLIVACLNYILLTLTEAVSRSQEVGVRKTIGAERIQIVLQFYIETQLLAFIAVVIGVLLAILCLPVFNNLMDTNLQQAFSFKNVAVTLSLAVALGLLAGIYPALVMSGLKPLSMMRRYSSARFNPTLSRLLMVIQSSVGVILISATLVASKQMRYVSQKDLGFDKEHIITVGNPFSDDLQTGLQLKNNLAHFAAQEPSIDNFTSCFLGYFNINTHLIRNERIPVEAFDIDFNYFSFFKIPIIKGRDFSQDLSSDSAALNLAAGQYMEGASRARQPVVVNETLYRMLGSPALNEINRELGGLIIGVCKDYYPDDLTKKIVPAYHRIARNRISYFSFRIKANQNIPQVVNKIKRSYNSLTGNEPFSYTFLDETLAKNYNSYLRWMKTITVSSILSLIIACMGLFGLSGLIAAGRIKEIGIRKVFGASNGRLFLLLNKRSFITAIISFGIALPFSIYLANEWLQNFAYRIKLDWSLFALTGIISLATAFIAVSYHIIKASRANPVKSLRPE